MLREYVNIANSHFNNNNSKNNKIDIANNHLNNNQISKNLNNSHTNYTFNNFFKQLKAHHNNNLNNHPTNVSTSFQHHISQPTPNNTNANLQHIDPNYIDIILNENIDTANSYFNDNSSSDYASRESYESICNLEHKLGNDLVLHANGVSKKGHYSTNQKTLSLVKEDLKNFKPSATEILELQTALQQNNYLIQHFTQQYNQLQNDHQLRHQQFFKKVANKLTRLWRENIFLRTQLENYFKKQSISNSLFSSVSSHDSIKTIQNTDKLLRKEHYNSELQTPPETETLLYNISNNNLPNNTQLDLPTLSDHILLPTQLLKTTTEQNTVGIDPSKNFSFTPGLSLAACLNDDEGFLEDNDELESQQSRSTKILPSYQQHMQRKIVELQSRKEFHSGWRFHRKKCNLSKSFPSLGQTELESAGTITNSSSNFQIIPMKSTSAFFEVFNTEQSQNSQSKQSLELVMRTKKYLPFTSCFRIPIKNRPQNINHAPSHEPTTSTKLERSDSEKSLNDNFCRKSTCRTNLRIKNKSGKLLDKVLSGMQDLNMKQLNDNEACELDAVLNEKQ